MLNNFLVNQYYFKEEINKILSISLKRILYLMLHEMHQSADFLFFYMETEALQETPKTGTAVNEYFNKTL